MFEQPYVTEPSVAASDLSDAEASATSSKAEEKNVKLRFIAFI